MAGIMDRNRQKKELIDLGYSVSWIDESHPKVTLYWHRDTYNIEGELQRPFGTPLYNQNGTADTVLNKAKIGLFQWPPSESCTCRWCVQRAKATEKETKQAKLETVEPS